MQSLQSSNSKGTLKFSVQCIMSSQEHQEQEAKRVCRHPPPPAQPALPKLPSEHMFGDVGAEFTKPSLTKHLDAIISRSEGDARPMIMLKFLKDLADCIRNKLRIILEYVNMYEFFILRHSIQQ